MHSFEVHSNESACRKKAVLGWNKSRHSQPYSQECDWLGPDLTQNNQGQYILIFPAVLITLTICLISPVLSWYHIIHLLREW